MSETAGGVRPRCSPLPLLVCQVFLVYAAQTAISTAYLLRWQDQGYAGPYLSGVLLAMAVPLVLFAPVAGALADRFDARPLIAAGAAMQVLAGGALAVLDTPVSVLVALLLYAIGMAQVSASLQVMLPTVVPVRALGRATSYATAAQTGGFVIGPAVAGMLVTWSGHGSTLACAVGASLMVLMSVVLSPAVAPRERPAPSLPFGGGRSVDPASVAVVCYTGALALALHPTAVVEVVLVRDSLGASAAVLGAVSAAWSAGMVVGSLVAGRWRLTQGTLVRNLLLCGGVQAGVLGLAGLSSGPAMLTALYAVGGFWCGATNVARQTLLTVRAPEGRRGRVLALSIAVHNGVQMLGLCLGGVAIELFDPRVAYVAAGALGVLATLLCAPWLMRGISVPPPPAPETADEREEPRCAAPVA